MSKTLIELQNVSKVFQVKAQDAVVLHSINTSFNEGEFFIIFGPSGCGKSTLLHIILGLEKPTTGICKFMGYNLYAFTEDERSEFRKTNIGMVYQQPNWIKSLTVIENVMFALSLNGVDKAQAHKKAFEMLKLVGMQYWADYLPSELSSGQQQKVALARALITDPQIIIADEPTGNLDYQSGIELMTLFKKLQKEGKTVLMVTHNIETLDYATKIVQMFDGQVVKVIDVAQESMTNIKKELLIHRTYTPIPNFKDPKLMARLKKKRFNILMHIPPLFSLRAWKTGIKILFKNSLQVFRFLSFLTLYFCQKVLSRISTFRFAPQFIKDIFGRGSQKIHSLQEFLDRKRKKNTISRSDLIDLSIKNMFAKRTRTLITIGGMTIGIAAIVFLVSVGYGLEKLVISRVARLDEMKQIDAIPAVASNVSITDKSLSQFKEIKNVKKVLPIIGVVGKVTYNKSSIDVAAYGVLTDYLQESAIKPVDGKLFSEIPETKTKAQAAPVPAQQGQVAGASTTLAEYKDLKSHVQYTIEPNTFLRVRTEPTASSVLLGYTRRVEGQQEADEIWGSPYISDDKQGEAGTDEKGQKLGLWLKVTMPLWQETPCSEDTQPECEENKYMPVKKEDGTQQTVTGYIAKISVQTSDEESTPQVIGISDEISSDEATLMADESVEETPTPAVAAKTVKLDDSRKRETVVNKAFLKVLGLAEDKGVGKEFTVSFITTGDVGSQDEKLVSAPITYKIVGVTPDMQSPIIYVPIEDIKQMGMNSYTQVKLVVNNEDQLAQTRRQVEVLGYKTTSVVDTVSQIEKLFSTLRLVLGLLGVVALGVAALGMFNTLTISLLERTREVGMMKAIGMQSEEVQDLFLTESMIMGLFGGLGGLVLGFILGKLTSFFLSTLSIYKGAGFLDVTYIPWSFILLIVVLSLMVGILTGMYPARRATKISALDALRYE